MIYYVKPPSCPKAHIVMPSPLDQFQTYTVGSCRASVGLRKGAPLHQITKGSAPLCKHCARWLQKHKQELEECLP